MAELKKECPKCKSKELDIMSKEYKYMPGKTGQIRYQYCLDCDWEQTINTKIGNLYKLGILQF